MDEKDLAKKHVSKDANAADVGRTGLTNDTVWNLIEVDGFETGSKSVVFSLPQGAKVLQSIIPDLGNYFKNYLQNGSCFDSELFWTFEKNVVCA